MNKLCDAIGAYSQSGQPVELHTAYVALTLDFISHYAFGESFGLLERRGFSPAWKRALIDSIEAGRVVRYFPWLADIMKTLPESLVVALNKPIAVFLHMQKVRNEIPPTFPKFYSAKRVQDVRKQVEGVFRRKWDPEKANKTIFEALLDSDLPPQEKTVDRLLGEGFILVGAGGETTAHTLAVLSFHLLNNPEILKKLRAELVEVMPDPCSPVSWQQLEQLPFLVGLNLTQETL